LSLELDGDLAVVRFPPKLRPLFEPKRYKVFYGGRGGAKSWGIARALLIMGRERPLRILCAREVQKSIQDSVYQLLRDQISLLGLDAFYQSTLSEIRGANGTLFIFAGLKHNIDSIRSKEGIDIVWIEEAQVVSKSSWDALIPTVRKEKSEIWVSFNPELDTDETYQRFVLHPSPDALVVKIGWQDNPWFPDVLKSELEHLKAKDTDAYLNVWEGHCRQTLEGAIYAQELRKAQAENRITRVPYDPIKPVDVFCDLGWSDHTSLWFVQKVGFDYRALKAYQNRQQPWNFYLSHIQAQGYVLGTVWLPHDAQAKSLGTGKSIEEITRAAGFNVRIVPMLSVEDGINALRTVFPNVYFDAEGCSDGIQALRRYRYEVDPDTHQFSRKPLHDDSSHYADGARYFAVAMREGNQKKPAKPRIATQAMSGAWMGR
jgi:phage terminase large subunit